MEKYLNNHKAHNCSFIIEIGKVAISSISKKTLLLSPLLFLLSCSKNVPFPERTESKQRSGESIEAITSMAPSLISCPIDAFNDNVLINDGWVKTFDDEFNILDRTNWSVRTQVPYNNDLAYYQEPNVTANGVLEIKVKKEAAPHGYAYTSGRIESVQLFGAGNVAPLMRIYARIKLPKAYGLWPAFWTYGDPWAGTGEVDIMESRGQETNLGKYQTNYFYHSINCDENHLQSSDDLTACFHVYMVEWTQNTLKYYLDGELKDTKVSTGKNGGNIPNLFGQAHHITLDVALWGDFFPQGKYGIFDPGQFHAGKMEVDWVKVFVRQKYIPVLIGN